MSPSSVETITVVSSDGDEFKMTVGAAMQSEQMKCMLMDDCSFDKVPMPNVNTETLMKVMEYCEKHADHEAATKANGGGASDSDAVEELKRWDAEFMEVDVEETIFHILMAAHYLEIEGLFEFACETVADLMKGKTPKQIRRIFNIKNDFTPEEQERLSRQHHCSFD